MIKPENRTEGGEIFVKIFHKFMLEHYEEWMFKSWEELTPTQQEMYKKIYEITVMPWQLELYDLRHKADRTITRLDFALSSLQEKDEKIQELEQRLCQQRQNYLDMLKEESK